MKKVYLWGITLLVLLFILEGIWLYLNLTSGQKNSGAIFYVPNAGDETISIINYEQ